MDEALIDSDILSELIKARNPRVSDAAKLYRIQHRRLSFSAITLYEISRGFLAAGTMGRLADFLEFAAKSEVLPVSIHVLERQRGYGPMLFAAGVRVLIPILSLLRQLSNPTACWLREIPATSIGLAA